MSECTTADCQSVDPLFTPCIDGELAAADRARLDAHVRLCAPCRERLDAERSVRHLFREEHAALCRDRAPLALAARCRDEARAAQEARAASVPTAEGVRRRVAGGVFAAFRRQRLAPVAAAATIVVAAGIGIVYQATGSSVRLLAAELTADHVKCALLNRVLGTGHDHQGAPAGADVEAVERWLGSTFSWKARLPDAPEQAGLELVGSRQCLFGQGTAAHIVYRDFRHQGELVSVFMVPGQTRTDALVAALGHEASVWSDGSRTFVLLARQPREDVQRLAAFINASIR